MRRHLQAIATVDGIRNPWSATRHPAAPSRQAPGSLADAGGAAAGDGGEHETRDGGEEWGRVGLILTSEDSSQLRGKAGEEGLPVRGHDSFPKKKPYSGSP